MHNSGVRGEDRVKRDFAFRVGAEVDRPGWCDSYEVGAQSFEQGTSTFVLYDILDALVYTGHGVTMGRTSWRRGRAKVRESNQSVPGISMVNFD